MKIILSIIIAASLFSAFTHNSQYDHDCRTTLEEFDSLAGFWIGGWPGGEGPGMYSIARTEGLGVYEALTIVEYFTGDGFSAEMDDALEVTKRDTCTLKRLYFNHCINNPKDSTHYLWFQKTTGSLPSGTWEKSTLGSGAIRTNIHREP